MVYRSEKIIQSVVIRTKNQNNYYHGKTSIRQIQTYYFVYQWGDYPEILVSTNPLYPYLIRFHLEDKSLYYFTVSRVIVYHCTI